MASGGAGCVSVITVWIKESETSNCGLTDYGVVIIPITNTIQQIKYKYAGFWFFLKKRLKTNQKLNVLFNYKKFCWKLVGCTYF